LINARTGPVVTNMVVLTGDYLLLATAGLSHPVFALGSVMDDAGLEFEEDDEETEVNRFRELLEEVTVEDFLGEEPGHPQE
jgi:hypothetical protein